MNGQLGGPGDNQSLSTGLTNLASAFAIASQSPGSAASSSGVANALQNLASNISTTSNTITALQGQIDGQVSTAIPSTNALIQQIYQLNQQIKTATAAGDTSSALLDQRDVALNSLSQVISIRVTPQADGSENVSTADGVNLVSNTYATLSYNGGAANGTYSNIQIQDVNPQSGQLLGAASALDPHLSGGSLKGMIDMRDQTLGGLAQTLGNLAQNVTQAFNAQSNANAAFPPPTSLTGHETGLLSSDALNFSGKTTIAVTDSSGNLVSRIDVDFGAGTLSVDGGPTASIGTTVGSFTTALNSALGSNGSASFTGGKLSIAATGSNGIVVQDDATTPSSRAGTPFSQFFGLNDLLQGGAPSIAATGLSAGDASGIAAGGNISLSLKGPDGDIVKQVSVTTTAGMTIGNIVTALNSAMGGAATFTLNSNGSISTATSALYPNYALNVTNDTTQRGFDRRQLHRIVRHRRQPDRQPGHRLPGGAGGCQQPAAHRPGHARDHAVHRGGRHRGAERGFVRRHCLAERHHQHPQLCRRRWPVGADFVAVGLCRLVLSDPFQPIERGDQQPDHPG